MGWLLASISETILPRVAHYITSRDVWLALERIYASRSQARLLQLRFELQTMKKGTKSMADYISHAISLTDALSVAGSSIPDQELCLFILGGTWS